MRALRWGVTALLASVGLGVASAGQQQEELVFGVFPYLSPAQLVEFHSPLRQMLAETLHRPVTLVTAPDFETFIERTRDGTYDIILTAPHMGRLAERRDGYRRLAQSENRVQGAFIARADSGIARLQDLRGKRLMIVQRIAVVNQLAFDTLRRHGLEEGRDLTIVETRTHNNALTAPLRGEADAALVSAVVWDKLGPEHHGRLRQFATTPAITGLLVLAGSRVGAREHEVLQRALLGLERTPAGAAYFERSGLKGFRSVDDATMASFDPYTRVLVEKSR
jgi:phosphonate transport system substrate-binding protein